MHSAVIDSVACSLFAVECKIRFSLWIAFLTSQSIVGNVVG